VLGYGGLDKHPHLVAGLVAYGPIAFGFLLRHVFEDRLALSWPFHKTSWPEFGGHLVIG
jgi:hypothetical protein